MGRPRKTLEQLVNDGTFLCRRVEDRRLLLGPPLRWPNFANLQARYQAATSEPEGRDVALQFERLVRAAHKEALSRQYGEGASSAELLAAELAELGRPGSVEQLLAFFPACLLHPKGPLRGQPFQLEPWQKRFLREFFRRNRHGRRVYRLGLLAIPRGNGKTAVVAGLALYELITRTDAPEIYLAAGSKEQAGICFEFARAFVEQGPLADWITVKRGQLSCAASSGTLKVISSEGSLQHGRAPAVAIIDELHAFETARQEETYRALTSALLKREDAYLLVITTAGHDKHSLLGRIYDAAQEWPRRQLTDNGCLTVASDEANGNLFYWYGAPDRSELNDTKIWRACNPASFIRISDLKRQLHDPGLGERGFRRLHLNKWTTSREAWLPDGLWQSLESDVKIPDRASVHIGVDIGISHDTSAVSWAYRFPNGEIVIRTKVWAVDPKAAAHVYVPEGEFELERIEQFILETLASRFKIVEVAYDPNFFHRSAQLLAKAGITVVEFLPASATTLNAYQSFYQLALERRLRHNGDKVLAAHIEATAAYKNERGWKLSKLRNTSRIDATIASVLAIARAQQHIPAKPNIFWMEP